MAIYQTQGIVVNFTGDGVSTTFVLDVVGYIDPRTTPKVPSALLLLQSNMGAVTGTMVGTTITATFATAPTALTSGQLYITLGF